HRGFRIGAELSQRNRRLHLGGLGSALQLLDQRLQFCFVLCLRCAVQRDNTAQGEKEKVLEHGGNPVVEFARRFTLDGNDRGAERHEQSHHGGRVFSSTPMQHQCKVMFRCVHGGGL